ncbi:uncharacterized protein PG998_008690 [Apiospora kogelbergensis]|uniref:Uncharacterized protein n=1 Tax=Apiospora kogelbergensis TaxID=1337665 RepID=A0AAW0QR24_9PEZI
MARSKKANKEFWDAVMMGVKTVFAAAVILIFVFVILVNAKSFDIPEWGTTWQTATPEKRNEYAAILFGIVCTLFVLFFAAGTVQLVKESRAGVSIRR